VPKSASPVRLQQELMQSATLAGARHHRSAAEQIEYWAMLGRQVAGVLDPDKLLDVLSGLAGLRVEPVTSAAVAPEPPSARKDDASPTRPHPTTRGLDGAEQCVVTARRSKLM